MSGLYSLTVALHCATKGAPPGAAAGGSATACVPHNGRLADSQETFPRWTGQVEGPRLDPPQWCLTVLGGK